VKNIANKYFEAIKKLMPEPKPHSQVGIDIGVNSCKMVELISHGGTSHELVNWAIEPVVDGDKEKAINSLMDKLKAPCTSPSTAVSGKGTLIRYIDLARMTLTDLKKSFMIEADKYFPFPVDQIFTDCHIIDSKAKDNKMAVLVAAAKKELINDRIALLTRAGLQVSFIGLNAVAITNIFSLHGLNAGKDDSSKEQKKEAEAVAILDMGAEVSNLTILVNDIPRFTRDIFISGNDFSRSISNALGVSFEEAEEIKSHPNNRQGEMRKAIEPVVSNLVSEMRLSFDYFVTEKNIPISKLLLTGGNAAIEKLPEDFSNYLEIPVALWNPIESLNISSDVNADDLKKNIGRLAVALGLALY
jgi:type IV pilus assembly protein PilM